MKKQVKFIVFMALSLSFSSCAVGPDFKKPKAPNVSAYTPDHTVEQITDQHFVLNKPVVFNWWQTFHSPELNQVMELGIQDNYDLAAMRNKLRQAQEIVNAATGQLLPQAALSGNVATQKYGQALFGNSSFVIPPFTAYSIGPSVNFMPDIFGGTRRTVEQKQALADYQNQELRAAFLELTGGITSTALTLATLNAQIDNTQEIIREDKKNLDLVQKAYQLGSGTKVDVLSAEGQLANDQTLLPALYQQLSVVKDQLNVLVGKFPANWQPPDFKLKNFVLPKELPLSVPSALVRARPDILAAEALLHAASAMIGVKTANLYPQINLSAITSQQATVFDDLFNASSNAGSLIGSITTSLFSGGTLQAERRSAIYAYKAAYDNYKKVVVQAFVQVSNVLHSLKNDEEEIKSQQKALQTAEASLNLSRLSYQAGNTGLLEILYAERLYTQALLGYQKALAARYQDTSELYVVLGGGMENKV